MDSTHQAPHQSGFSLNKSVAPFTNWRTEPVLQSKNLRFLSLNYPDDYLALALVSVDFRVTNEEPSYTELDDLAQYLGAKEVFHGHHHDSRYYRAPWLAWSFEAYGVPFREIIIL